MPQPQHHPSSQELMMDGKLQQTKKQHQSGHLSFNPLNLGIFRNLYSAALGIKGS